MNGWSYLIAGAVCVSGMLSFLRTVACAIGAADGTLKSMEERQRKERKPPG
jgi:hypothetical protein